MLVIYEQYWKIRLRKNNGGFIGSIHTEWTNEWVWFPLHFNVSLCKCICPTEPAASKKCKIQLLTCLPKNLIELPPVPSLFQWDSPPWPLIVALPNRNQPVISFNQGSLSLNWKTGHRFLQRFVTMWRLGKSEHLHGWYCFCDYSQMISILIEQLVSVSCCVAVFCLQTSWASHSCHRPAALMNWSNCSMSSLPALTNWLQWVSHRIRKTKMYIFIYLHIKLIQTSRGLQADSGYLLTQRTDQIQWPRFPTFTICSRHISSYLVCNHSSIIYVWYIISLIQRKVYQVNVMYRSITVNGIDNPLVYPARLSLDWLNVKNGSLSFIWKEPTKKAKHPHHPAVNS